MFLFYLKKKERGQFAINLKKMQAKTRRVSEFVF